MYFKIIYNDESHLHFSDHVRHWPLDIRIQQDTGLLQNYKILLIMAFSKVF